MIPSASVEGPAMPRAFSKHRPGFRFLLILGATLALVISGCWYFRAPLLTGLAHAWEVNDPLEPADAIVVLGGGLNTRPFFAVKLHREHLAPRILLAETDSTPANDIGVTSRETDASREVLLKLGVPAADIITFGKDVTSTQEEAIALRDWLRQNKLNRIIIPTDFTHTRRVKWLMEHTLPPGTRITVVATPSLHYDESNWWQREEGIISFQNEVIKSVYYRVKY